MIHTFADSIDKSNSDRAHQYWTAAYRSLLGDQLSGTIWVTDTDQQRRGVDRLLVLMNGRVIGVEEKLRSKIYTRPGDPLDILLEYLHSDGLPGWIDKPLAAEYLAYSWEPTREVYLLPTLLLQLAWEKNKSDWHGKAGLSEDGFRYTHTTNSVNGRSYVTHCLAVPLKILQIAMHRCSHLAPLT